MRKKKYNGRGKLQIYLDWRTSDDENSRTSISFGIKVEHVAGIERGQDKIRAAPFFFQEDHGAANQAIQPGNTLPERKLHQSYFQWLTQWLTPKVSSFF